MSYTADHLAWQERVNHEMRATFQFLEDQS
jgi:hypothetical protein